MSIVVMIFFVCILIPDYPSIQRIQKNLKRLFTVSVLGVVVLFGITDIGTDIIAQTPFSHVATRIENAKIHIMIYMEKDISQPTLYTVLHQVIS